MGGNDRWGGGDGSLHGARRRREAQVSAGRRGALERVGVKVVPRAEVVARLRARAPLRFFHAEKGANRGFEMGAPARAAKGGARIGVVKKG